MAFCGDGEATQVHQLLATQVSPHPSLRLRPLETQKERRRPVCPVCAPSPLVPSIAARKRLCTEQDGLYILPQARTPLAHDDVEHSKEHAHNDHDQLTVDAHEVHVFADRLAWERTHHSDQDRRVDKNSHLDTPLSQDIKHRRSLRTLPELGKHPLSGTVQEAHHQD